MPSDVDIAIAQIEIQLAVISEAARIALDEHVNKVFRISTETYCPVDKGNLKGSAKKEVVVDTLDEKTWRISYSIPYAPFVHERLDLRHTNPPEACAKFLERAVTETNDELFNDIQDAIKFDN